MGSSAILAFSVASIFICFPPVGGSSGEVSFFGSSHVSVRLQEARSSSDIYFRLRTRRLDSMLFLAAGRTDYCLLVLDAGKLKVHINLGAGETEIASEAPFLLNDMKWHTVNLTRRGSQLSIQVDHHFTKANLPTRFHELNIHFGVWLGGLAGFSEIFLGNLPSYRGCMSHITYNGEDVLLRAKTQPGEISGVSWNCSEEFEGPPTSSFSMDSSSSYVITRIAIPRQGTLIKVHVRTVQPTTTAGDGLILYISGMSSRPDYIAVQIRNNKVQFIAETGGGPVELQGNSLINDGNWHAVTIQVSPLTLSLSVDNGTWTAEPPARGASRHLDVSEIVYLGGVEDSKRNKLKALGLIDHSFPGCLQNVVVDSRHYGLPDVDVSRNISVGCSIECRECGESGKMTKFLVPPTSSSVKVNETLFSSSRVNSSGVVGGLNSSNSLDVISVSRDVIRIVTQTSQGDLEIMRVSPIHVAEGDSVSITPRHLAITLDLSKFGVKESGVLFKVSKPPEEGRLEVTSRATGSGSRGETFALLDVGAGRVRYYHNGAETSRDTIELVLKLVQNPGFILPAYLQDERLITLPVEISAVNDPPQIRLVPGGVLRLAEGTKIRLLPQVITASDPDTIPELLQFSLIPTESKGTAGNQGFELAKDPGKPIQTFTQEDLQKGNVWYVDHGVTPSSKVALKVTDGSSISPPTLLRIETFPLRIVPESNSGLEVANVMGTTVFLTSANLSFTSNAADQGVPIEFQVTSGPSAGILQTKRISGQWVTSTGFTTLDLSTQGVRYLLQRPSEVPFDDEFTFQVSLSKVKVPSDFRFRFRILSVRLDHIGLNVLVFNETVERLLSTRQLEYRTAPVVTPDSQITYLIVQSPRYGHLTSTAFTQEDLVAKRILYKFTLRPYSSITDSFSFNVSTPHLIDGPFKCQIHHSTRLRPAGVTLKTLTVTEGSAEFITTNVLFLKISDKSPPTLLHYNVTTPPSHGILGIGTDLPMSLTSFTSQDLGTGRLFYQHDGTEFPTDQVTFVAWSSSANFIFEGTLPIGLRGVNNQSPRRGLATFALPLVFGGMRRVTSTILQFIDDDWDASPGSLKYTLATVGNNGLGQFYDRTVSLSRPIFSWTQGDIDGGKLIFSHGGPLTQGVLAYWVSDGTFSSNGTLDIKAGPPWISVNKTSTLAGKRGAVGTLTENSIRIETNVDIDPETIVIRILNPPRYGVIKMNGNFARNFSLGEMNQGMVTYQSTTPPMDIPRDIFQFQAVASTNKGIAESELTSFEIALYPDVYWTPLTVFANSSIFVKENSSALISQRSLLITQNTVQASDIIYTLTRPPRHGYLTIDPPTGQDDSVSAFAVTIWDQLLINDHRLRYVQSQPNCTHDSMDFDVSNGVRSLTNLRLDVIIIPTILTLASAPLYVNEGGSIVLNLTHLHAAQTYYANKLAEVRVVTGPIHGSLGMISRPKGPLQSFPYKALHENKILYVHDGSETLSDSIVVVATTMGTDLNDEVKLSVVHSLMIKVIPGNDEVPRVVNNTGTWVWAGGTTLISNTELGAIDEDSDETNLVFYVVGKKGGFPAIVDQPEIPLHNFTQKMINASKIIFNHKGEDLKGASFDFEVSDGLNEANKETFKISIRKPELVEYEGRVPLSVFPLTQVVLRPENLLVRSSDGREINFKTSSGPGIGQVLIERSENKFFPVSLFTQTEVNEGKIFYQHLKPFRGQRANDSIRFTATSRYADPLFNITLEMDISVSGAALGGLQRYVTIVPLTIKEGDQGSITNQNLNLTPVLDFITVHHRGSLWRGGNPTLRLLLSEVPRHGWILEGDEEQDARRLRPGEEIPLPMLSTPGGIRYAHDDSETTSDLVGVSLWFWTNDTNSSTWLLNMSLPVTILPVNDQPFHVASPKSPTVPVVQEHWRKLSRNDLLTSDPDTPSTHILYTVSKVSHGRFVLVEQDKLLNVTGDTSPSWQDIGLLRKLPSVTKFTQADINAGRVLLHHSGSIGPVIVNLGVTDGQFPLITISLTIPVQPLALTASQSSAIPVRITQGNSVMTLSPMNLPTVTNGHVTLLVYNLTRHPLHGKVLLRDRLSLRGQSTVVSFSHSDLIHGDLTYVQTDLSVANDSFEVSAHYGLESSSARQPGNWPISNPRQVSTSWLVNVVSVPLLKRVKEVRTFVKGFAVGGIVAPDEGEFSAAVSMPTVLSLAVLDASPLAAVTGANPTYEILLSPKFGQLFKISGQLTSYVQDEADMVTRVKRAVGSSTTSRVASRFSHEDIRRGLIIYTPSSDLLGNDILPLRLTLSSSSALSSSSIADEFIFKVLAPGVQPALGIAKFNIRTIDTRYFDEKQNVISDGSTDPATKRGDTFRDFTSLVSPHVTKDTLITGGVVLAGIVTLTVFLAVAIRCSCVKKRPSVTPPPALADPKCNGLSLSDGYTPTTTCTLLDAACQSDSECSHHQGGTILRPLLMSPLSPRSRHRVGTSQGSASESGSWTSSGNTRDALTPSMPQCRVVPLCSSTISTLGSISDVGPNGMMLCPLLPPIPICDTFSSLPEEIDPPDGYGFTYGSLQPTVLDIQQREREEETHFNDYLAHPSSSSTTNTLLPGNSAATGTLRRTQGKNQYWV